MRFYNFNPRSYKRSDFLKSNTGQSSFISIHAPTRGATEEQQKNIDSLHISIHAPTRGATNYHRKNRKVIRYFNPRSYKRSDNVSLNMGYCRKFQSTLLQEERLQKCTIILILICNNYCIVSIKSHQHYNNYFM